MENDRILERYGGVGLDSCRKLEWVAMGVKVTRFRGVMFRRALCFSLILAFISYGFPVNGSEKIRAAVVPLDHPAVDSVATQKLADRLRREMERDGTIEVISADRTVEGLASLAKSGRLGPGGIGAAITKAKEYYMQLDFGTARWILQACLERLKKTGISVEERPDLITAYTFLGNLYYITGDNGAATHAFKEAVRLDPKLMLSETEYSPTVRSLFEEAKGQMVAEGSVAPEVTVNPAPKGRGDRVALKLTDPDRQEEIFSKSTEIAGFLNLDRLVLLQVEQRGGGFQAVAHLFEGGRNRLSRKSVTLGDSVKWIGIGARMLADFVAESVELPAVMQAASKTGRERPSEEGRPLWKRPVFWIIGGAVLAGAGTGLGIALSNKTATEVGVTVSGGAPSFTIKLR